MSTLMNILNTGKFLDLVAKIQHNLSTNAFEIIKQQADSSKDKLISYIIKYIDDNRVIIDGYNNIKLADMVYNELREYSVLTPLLLSTDLEEININSWNDIQIKYRDGRIEKAPHFYSLGHAVDIMKRLLSQNGTIIDGLNPIKESHIKYGHNKIRITVIINPVVDENTGLSASLRILSSKIIPREQYINTEFISDTAMDFLECCVQYGVSTIFAGRVGTGKTTFQNYVLSTLPNHKRIFTIETGSRELDLVKYDEQGNIVNNVIHTLTRPHENPLYNINQESLIMTALRCGADTVSVAEIRGTEAYAGQEASMTGNTVVTTLHASGAVQAHNRIAELCRKLYPQDYETAMLNTAMAFPIVVFIHTLANNVRRVMSITECVVDNNKRTYVPIFKYIVDDDDKGYFEQTNKISANLVDQMQMYGIPKSKLAKFV